MDSLGYVSRVPPESAAERTSRRQRVAARRRGPSVIVHRGASAFAPENTLEAYAAALDYGADGCEIDLRRTADGVLVLFHDDMLDHLTDGFGTVEQLTYAELLALRPRFRYGRAKPETRPPTFAAVLTLARQRAMLLHLDVKRPGLEPQIAAMLDEADAWDHVVGVNVETAPGLVRHQSARLLRYKAPGLFEARTDMDPVAVRAALARPGEMIMVDDPRVSARELGRPGYQPVPLPTGLRQSWTASTAPPSGDELVPQQVLRRLIPEASREELLRLLGPPGPQFLPVPDPLAERRRTERIVVRAWAAERLGALGKRSREVATRLIDALRHRSLHSDWMYHGLDGAMAARALGRLGAVEAVPALIEAFRRVDPELRRVVDPRFASNPLAWTDFRTKMYVLPALGDLPCPAAKAFLEVYLAMDEEAARQLAPTLWDEAARALLRQKLTAREIERLLWSRHSTASGVAFQECLDHPTRERTAALATVAPWALSLPRAAAEKTERVRRIR